MYTLLNVWVGVGVGGVYRKLETLNCSTAACEVDNLLMTPGEQSLCKNMCLCG